VKREWTRSTWLWAGLGVVASFVALAADGPSQAAGAPDPDLGLPSAGLSFVRVLGGLGLVLTLFFGGVWVFRNWGRITSRRAGRQDLKVLEVKTLGVRQSLVVVGYRNQRFLVAAAPTGVTLLTQLPEVEVEDEDTEEPESGAAVPVAGVPAGARPDFVSAFRAVLNRQM